MAKPDILQKSHIVLNQAKTSREEALRLCGALLVKGGYVTPSYLDSMIKRENTLSTSIGNGLAFPHGESQNKKDVLHTGAVIVTYPLGIEWEGTTVYMVIAIAAGDPTYTTLINNVVTHLEDPVVVKKLVATASVDEIYSLLA